MKKLIMILLYIFLRKAERAERKCQKLLIQLNPCFWALIDLLWHRRKYSKIYFRNLIFSNAKWAKKMSKTIESFKLIFLEFPTSVLLPFSFEYFYRPYYMYFFPAISPFAKITRETFLKQLFVHFSPTLMKLGSGSKMQVKLNYNFLAFFLAFFALHQKLWKIHFWSSFLGGPEKNLSVL